MDWPAGTPPTIRSQLQALADAHFRTGAPSTADERIYVKSAGAWAGIL